MASLAYTTQIVQTKKKILISHWPDDMVGLKPFSELHTTLGASIIITFKAFSAQCFPSWSFIQFSVVSNSPSKWLCLSLFPITLWLIAMLLAVAFSGQGITAGRIAQYQLRHQSIPNTNQQTNATNNSVRISTNLSMHYLHKQSDES
jgi:hypothetical protein